jgi:hypothetical protein
MKAIKLIFVTVIIGMSFITCDNENDNQPSNCEQAVIISADLYKNAPNDQLTINKVEIVGDCLKISFAASGCSGKSWEVKLIDAGMIFYSNPPQRPLRLSLKNDELCAAVIGKEMTFDISQLQVTGNRVLLNFTNSGDQILYEY